MTKKNIKTITTLSLLIAPFLLVYLTSISVSTKQQKNSNPKKHLITIFIHGTILPFPSISALSKTIKNKNKEIRNYQKYQLEFRKNNFYKAQAIGELGLHKINIDNFRIKNFNPKKETNASQLISKIHKTLHTNQLKQTKCEYSFYTFGWDGRLNKKHRKQWGEKLYKELIEEIKKIKNQEIEICIIAHSHGGNVALNLAMAEDKFKHNLKINKLILFGTPIQSETKSFIDSAVFKNIYNIFSTGDNIQTLDNISSKDFFSKRKFTNKENGKCLLPKKLKQIEVKVGNKKPSHCELWFFGWTKLPIYRKSFPLYPLPVATFTPLIVDFIDNKIEKDQNIKLNIEKQKSELSLFTTKKPKSKFNIEFETLTP